MKKLVIVALIMGICLGVINFFMFTVFKDQLYSNSSLFNTLCLSELVLISLIIIFIFKQDKK